MPRVLARTPTYTYQHDQFERTDPNLLKLMVRDQQLQFENGFSFPIFSNSSRYACRYACVLTTNAPHHTQRVVKRTIILAYYFHPHMYYIPSTTDVPKILVKLTTSYGRMPSM